MSIRMINPGAGNIPNPVGDGVAVQPATVTIMTDTEVAQAIADARQILFVSALPATGDTTHIWCLNNNELWVWATAQWRRVNDKTHRINVTVDETFSLNAVLAYTMPADTYVRVNDFVVFDNLFCIVTAITGGDYTTGFACNLRVLTTDLSFAACYRAVANATDDVKVFESTTVPTVDVPRRARVGDFLVIGDPTPNALAIITAQNTTDTVITIIADAITNAVIYVANQAALPAIGDSDFLYITTNDQRAWFWTGTAYAHLSSVLYVNDKTALPTIGDPNFMYITLNDRKTWYYNGSWTSIAAGGMQVVDSLSDVVLKDPEVLYVVTGSYGPPTLRAAEAYRYNATTDTFIKIYELPASMLTSVELSTGPISTGSVTGDTLVPVIKTVIFDRVTPSSARTNSTAIVFRSNEDIIITRPSPVSPEPPYPYVKFELPYYVKFQDPLPDPGATSEFDRPKNNVIYKDSMQRLWVWDGQQHYKQIQGKVVSVEGYFPDVNGNIALNLNNHPSVNATNFDTSLIAKWFNGERQSNSWQVPSFPNAILFSVPPTIADFSITWYGKYPDDHRYMFQYYAVGSTASDAPANLPALCFEERQADNTLVDQKLFTDGTGYWQQGAWSASSFTSDQGGVVSYNSDPSEVDLFIQSWTDQGLITYNYQYYVDLSELINKVDTHIADDQRHLTGTERDKINQGLVTSVEGIKPDASGNVKLDLDNVSPYSATSAIWVATYDQVRKKHRIFVTAINQAVYTPPTTYTVVNFVLSDDGSQRGELRFWPTGKVEFATVNNGSVVSSILFADNGQWYDSQLVEFSGSYDSITGDNRYVRALPDNELGYQFAEIYSMAELNDDLAAEIARATAAEQQLQTNINQEATDRANADSNLQMQLDAMRQLGRYIGSVETYADIASFTLPPGAAERDFITVRHDETNANLSSRYIIQTLTPLTWTFDLTYNTDITGKVDKLISNWTPGNLVRSVNDGSGNGNIEDAGKNIDTVINEINTFILDRGLYMGTYDTYADMRAAMDQLSGLPKKTSWVLVTQDENNRTALYHYAGGTNWVKDYAWPIPGAIIPNLNARITVASATSTYDPLIYTVPETGWYSFDTESSFAIHHQVVRMNNSSGPCIYSDYSEVNDFRHVYSPPILFTKDDVIWLMTYPLNGSTVNSSYRTNKQIFKYPNRL